MSDDDLPGVSSDVFSKKVSSMLQEMGKTELCRPDLDLTTHINKIFPTEQSLSQLDSVIQSIEAEVTELDDELAQLVEAHGDVDEQQANSALKEAHAAIAELEAKILTIRGKTQSSETSVSGMTKDIKQLDIAKKNLTSSITTLHHLHLLLTGVNSLEGWIANKKYNDVAAELPAVLNVLQLFDDYVHIEQVKDLTEKVQRMKRTLSNQLALDLKQAFKAGQMNQSTGDMCKVAAVLGGPVQEEFRHWYISQQLAVYLVLYSDTECSAWLDKMEERYRWFVNKLAEFERAGASKVFPPSWEMGRSLAKEFCMVTRESLERLMNRRKAEIEWKLLSHAINHTIMFESLLCKRYPPKEGFHFDKIIWSLFDKHMDVFIAAQNKQLNQFLDERAAKIRSGEEKPSREANITAVPLVSSADLFLLLKRIITESMKLCAHPDSILKELVEIFRQCLRNYGYGCLSAFLPQVHVSSGSSTYQGLIGTLMRDHTTTAVRLNVDQQFFTCCILATADWCAETAGQLQDKLKQRMEDIELAQEIELFYGISNSALTLLVQDIESACDASFVMMTKINWSNMESVGDESSYVAAIRKHLRIAVPLVRDYFADRRKYFAHLCLKLATQLVNKFLGALFRCKPVSVAGAEQLLLDTHALKTFLLGMPSVGCTVVNKPPTIFTNTVVKGMTKAEMLLKTVMADVSKPEEFIFNYTKMLPDSDAQELQKVLEMKAMRRSDQTIIIQLYKSKVDGQQSGAAAVATSSVNANATTTASALSSVMAMATEQMMGDSSSMKRLEKLVKRQF